MNHKDLCFLGLLALAYVYLDNRAQLPGASGMPRLDGDAALASGHGATLLPRGRYPLIDPGCPRDATHSVSRRKDGAMWCRGCDEAYYPWSAEWSALFAQA